LKYKRFVMDKKIKAIYYGENHWVKIRVKRK
jgi:hypothetical protein